MSLGFLAGGGGWYDATRFKLTVSNIRYGGDRGARFQI